MNKLKEQIESKYGSVDKMFQVKTVTISRSYMYQLMSGKKVSPTIDVLLELQSLLELELAEVVALFNEDKEV